MFSVKKLATVVLAIALTGVGLWAMLGTDAAPVMVAQPPKPDKVSRPTDQPLPTLAGIAALEAKRDQALRQVLEGKDKALEIEAELRDVRLRYERDRAERKRLETGKAIKVGQLAIVVVKAADPKVGPESSVYAVIETDLDGKAGGVFICSNLETLRQILAWAKRDLACKWQVVIRPAGTVLDSQANQHAYGAAQAIGFDELKYVADPSEAETSAVLDRLGWKHPSWQKKVKDSNRKVDVTP